MRIPEARPEEGSWPPWHKSPSVGAKKWFDGKLYELRPAASVPLVNPCHCGDPECRYEDAYQMTKAALVRIGRSDSIGVAQRAVMANDKWAQALVKFAVQQVRFSTESLNWAVCLRTGGARWFPTTSDRAFDFEDAK